MLSRLSLTLWIVVAVIGLGIGAAAAEEEPEPPPPAPFGVWLTQDEDSTVEIFECGEALCGRIVWMESEYDEDGNLLTDIYNPDPARRSTPVLGLIIMYEIKPTDENGVWEGRVYNPRDGRTYDFWLTVVSETQIIIEGCGLYGLICQEHMWQRAES